MANFDDTKRRKIYDEMSKSWDVGTYESFSNDMADEGKRRKVYDEMSKSWDVGTYEEFDNAVYDHSQDRADAKTENGVEWQTTAEAVAQQEAENAKAEMPESQQLAEAEKSRQNAFATLRDAVNDMRWQTPEMMDANSQLGLHNMNYEQFKGALADEQNVKAYNDVLSGYYDYYTKLNGIIDKRNRKNMDMLSDARSLKILMDGKRYEKLTPQQRQQILSDRERIKQPYYEDGKFMGYLTPLDPSDSMSPYYLDQHGNLKAYLNEQGRAPVMSVADSIRQFVKDNISVMDVLHEQNDYDVQKTFEAIIKKTGLNLGGYTAFQNDKEAYNRAIEKNGQLLWDTFFAGSQYGKKLRDEAVTVALGKDEELTGMVSSDVDNQFGRDYSVIGLARNLSALRGINAKYDKEKTAVEAGWNSIKDIVGRQAMTPGALYNEQQDYLKEITHRFAERGYSANAIDYIIGGIIKDNFVVDTIRRAVNTDFKNMIDEESKRTDPNGNMLTNFTRGLGSMALEMPMLYGPMGKAAGLVVKGAGKGVQAIAKMLPKNAGYIERLAEFFMRGGTMTEAEAVAQAEKWWAMKYRDSVFGQWVGTPIAQATHEALTFGGADALKGGLYGASSGYDWWDPIPEGTFEGENEDGTPKIHHNKGILNEATMRGLKGMCIGGAMGGIRFPFQIMGYGGSGSRKTLANLLGFESGALAMTGVDYGFMNYTPENGISEIDQLIVNENMMRMSEGGEKMTAEEETMFKLNTLGESLVSNNATLAGFKIGAAGKFLLSRGYNESDWHNDILAENMRRRQNGELPLSGAEEKAIIRRYYSANGQVGREWNLGSVLDNIKSNISDMTRQGRFEKQMRFTDTDKRMINAVAPEMMKAMGEIAKNANDLTPARTELDKQNLGKVLDGIYKMASDEGIPQKLISKMIYRFTNGVYSPGYAAYTEVKQDDNGMFILTAHSADGRLIDKQEYKSVEEAQRAEEEYTMQKEMVAIQRNTQGIIADEVNRNFFKWLAKDYAGFNSQWIGEAYFRGPDGRMYFDAKKAAMALGDKGAKAVEDLTEFQKSVALVMRTWQEGKNPWTECPQEMSYVLAEYQSRCSSIRDIKRKVADEMGVGEEDINIALEGRDLKEARYLDPKAIYIGLNTYRTQQDQKIVDAFKKALSERSNSVTDANSDRENTAEAVKQEVKAHLSSGKGATPLVNRLMVQSKMAEESLKALGLDPNDASAIASDVNRSPEERKAASDHLRTKEALKGIDDVVGELTDEAMADRQAFRDQVENVSGEDETPMGYIISATFQGKPVYVWKGYPAGNELVILKDMDGNIITDENGNKAIPSKYVTDAKQISVEDFLKEETERVRGVFENKMTESKMGYNLAEGETFKDANGEEHTVLGIQESVDAEMGTPVKKVLLGYGEATKTVDYQEALDMRSKGLRAEIEKENEAMAEKARLDAEAEKKRQEEEKALAEQNQADAQAETEAKPEEVHRPAHRDSEGKLTKLATKEDGRYDYQGMTPKEAVDYLNGEDIPEGTTRFGRKPGYANDIAKIELDNAVKALNNLMNTPAEGANQDERDAVLLQREKDAQYLQESVAFWGDVLDEAGRRQYNDSNFKGIIDSFASYDFQKKAPEMFDWMSQMAQMIGYKVGMVDSRVRNEIGSRANGKNMLDKRTIWLNMWDASQDITPDKLRLTYKQYVGQVFGHELTHTFFRTNRQMLDEFIAKTKSYLGEEKFKELADTKIRIYLTKKNYDAIFGREDIDDAEKYRLAYEKVKEVRNVNGMDGKSYVEEEVACDMAGQLMGDEMYMRQLAIGDMPRATDKSVSAIEEAEAENKASSLLSWLRRKIDWLFGNDEQADEVLKDKDIKDAKAEERNALRETYQRIFDNVTKEIQENHQRNKELRIKEAEERDRLEAEYRARQEAERAAHAEEDAQRLAIFQPYEDAHTERVNAIDSATTIEAKLNKARELYADYPDALAVFDREDPETLEEYVSGIGSHVIAWDDVDRSGHMVRGLKTELGLKRGIGNVGDTKGINDFLAAKGEGKGIEELAHELWEGRPEHLRHYDDVDIKEALLNVLSGSQSAKETRNMIPLNRLAEAERIAYEGDMYMAQMEYEATYTEVNGVMVPKTAEQVGSDIIGEEIAHDEADCPFSLREEPAPKKRKYGYKAFKLGKNGELYPPMVDNPDGESTPVGLFLNADNGVQRGKSATGRMQVEQTSGGSLSFRPAWHLGYMPDAKQFYGKGENAGKAKGDIVWALVEFDATNDYSLEADAFGINEKGTWVHSAMGCPYIPENGYYEMRTNPDPTTDAWALSGSMRVVHMLSRAEEAEVLARSGRQKADLYTDDALTDDIVNGINGRIDENLRKTLGSDEYLRVKDSVKDVMKMSFDDMHRYVYEDSESGYEGKKHEPTLEELRAVRSDADAERAYRYYQIIRKGGEGAQELAENIRAYKDALMRDASDKEKNQLKQAQRIWFEKKSAELEEMNAEELRNATHVHEADPENNIVVLDSNGEISSVVSKDGSEVMMSLRTYEENGREVLNGYLDELTGKNALTDEEADIIRRGMDEVYKEAKRIYDSGDYETFNYWSYAPVMTTKDGTVIYSVIKPNAEYGMNLDFSLICKKRRTLDAVLNLMTERGLINMLPSGKDDISLAIINDIIRHYGFETACKLCFVDAKRFRQAKVSDDFVNMYNGLVNSIIPKGSRIKANYFDFSGEGREAVDASIALENIGDEDVNLSVLKRTMKDNGNSTVMHKIAKYLLENPSERKLLQRSDFMGSRGFDAVAKYSREKGAEIDAKNRAKGIKSEEKSIRGLYNSKKGSGGPKSGESDIQYLNDVAKANWNPEKAFAVGGVRVQSFSDFVPHMVFDYAQMFAELAAGKLPAHAYTKEELFVKMFGKTGIKINMSLVPKVVEDGIAAGLDRDGNYVWDINRDENGNIIQAESFDYDEAVRIQNDPAYRNNVGTIAVGVSDAHIRKMMADPNIRMIIPYHASGINKKVAVHNGIDAFTDYTNSQNTRYAKSGKKLSKADHKKEKGFNEYLKAEGDPKKAVDAYLRDCAKKGWLPKFDQFLDKEYNDKGKYKDADGRRYDYKQSEGYYKLLEDFSTYIPDGKGGFEYHPQEAVRFELPTENDTFGSFADLMKRGLSEDEAVERKRLDEVAPIVDEIEKKLNEEGVLYSERDNVPAIMDGESITDYSARIKAWRENTRLSDRDEDRSMVGMHNLSEDNLRHALKMGGLANPSTAVVDMNVNGMTNFGEITLLMPSSLVAKKTGRNAGTWAADAYTPRYPVSSVVYRIGSKAENVLSKELGGGYSVESMGQILSGIEDKGIEGLRRSVSSKIAFAKSLGENPIVASASRYTPDITQTVEDNAYTPADEYGRRYVDRSQWTEEQKEALSEAYKKHFLTTHRDNTMLWDMSVRRMLKGFETPENALDWVKESNEEHRKEIEQYGTTLLKLERFATDVLRDSRNVGTPDRYETENEVNRIVQANKGAYDKWTQELYDRLGVAERLFQGFDDLGKRIYKAHTLENVSRMMKKMGKEGGEQFFNASPGAVRAKVAPIFKTLEEIRDAKERIVSSEEFEPVKEQINNECWELESLLEGDMSGEEGFYRLEEAMKHGAEWVNRRYDDIELDSEDIERINAFRQLMYEAPTEYFETKFERPVRLDEFKSAVVPNGTDAELVGALEDKGLSIYYYDPNVKGDRERVQNAASMEEGVRFSDRVIDADPFYSNAAKAVEGIKQGKGTGEQWLAMLRKNGGLKAEEDKWMGLSDWLKDKKSVAKEEVQNFIAENAVKVEEVHYAEGREVIENNENFARFNAEFEELVGQGDEATGSIYTSDWREWAFNQMVDKYGDEFRDAFEYNDNDELLPTYDWNDNLSGQARYFLDINESNDQPINDIRYDYTTEGLYNKREIALTVPTIEPYNADDEVHFGDAGEGRAVAWIRFGDATEKTPERIDFERIIADNDEFTRREENRVWFKLGVNGPEGIAEEWDRRKQLQTDARKKAEKSEGSKVLVIDEIQSKRHQDGREKGYTEPTSEMSIAERSLAERKKQAAERLDAYRAMLEQKYGRNYHSQRTPEEVAEESRLSGEWNDLALGLIREQKHDTVPDAPFRKNWHELAMKRMLRYAAENGYDKVAWTTGTQQAERYNIGGVVKSIYADHDNYDGNPHKYVSIYLNGGGNITFDVNKDGIIESSESAPTEYDGKLLSEVIGKELADKIVNLPQDQHGIEFGQQDLRLGGEGMKGFYDMMLPKFMDKYGKKWGVRTQDVALDLPNEADRVMHAVDVTPAMKESLMEGQAMFSERTLASAGTLFSGGGTLDYALKGVIEPKFAAEWDKKIAGVYKNNNGDHIVFGDATSITLPDIMKATNGGHVDYLHTSPVCKNFSGAKKDRGETDTDIEFGKACSRAIMMTEPDVYTLENVPQYAGSEALNGITRTLDTLGYTYDINVVDAADYGAATSRKRLILRAVRDGLTLPPLPAHKERGDWFERIHDDMRDEMLAGNAYDITEAQADEYLADLKRGVKSDWNYYLILGKQYGKWRSRIEGDAAPTILAQKGNKEMVIWQEEGQWKAIDLTTRMLAKIQGLGDDYQLPESSTLAHTIIGNGIPVELTQAVMTPLIKSRITERQERKQASSRMEKKYDNLAMMYIPEFTRGGKVENQLREIWDEYVLNQADDAIVPFLSPHMNYQEKGVSQTAHKLKGEKYVKVNGKRTLVPISEEAKQEAIDAAARDMSVHVPKDAVLVPMPSHTGKATDTVALAEAISKLTDAPVVDALEGLSRRSAYEQKVNTGKNPTPESFGIRWKEGVEKPEGKRIIYIDNVIQTGATAAAAVRAGGGGVVLSYAFSGKTKGNTIPLKSAELVTYGDNGQPVPLNDRFDPRGEKRGDIRYSDRGEEQDIDKTLYDLEVNELNKLRIRKGKSSLTTHDVKELGKQLALHEIQTHGVDAVSSHYNSIVSARDFQNDPMLKAIASISLNRARISRYGALPLSDERLKETAILQYRKAFANGYAQILKSASGIDDAERRRVEEEKQRFAKLFGIDLPVEMGDDALYSDRDDEIAELNLDMEDKARMVLRGSGVGSFVHDIFRDLREKYPNVQIGNISSGAFDTAASGIANAGTQKELGDAAVKWLRALRERIDNLRKQYVRANGMEAFDNNNFGELRKMTLPFFEHLREVNDAIRWYSEFAEGEHNKSGDHFDAGIKYSERVNNSEISLPNDQKYVPLSEKSQRSFTNWSGEYVEGMDAYENNLKNLLKNSGNENNSVETAKADTNTLRQYAEAIRRAHRNDRQGRGSLTDREVIEMELEAIKDERSHRSSAIKAFTKEYNIESDRISLQDLRRMFDDFNTDVDTAKLFDKVCTTLKNQSGDLYVTHAPSGGVRGYYIPFFGTTAFDWDALTRTGDGNKKASTICHELIHKSTLDIMRAYENKVSRNFLSANQYNAVKQIFDVYDAVKKANLVDENGKPLYGTKNAYEMIAELANPRFREALSKISYDYKEDKRNLWQRIKDAIRSLFVTPDPDGPGRKENALEGASKALDTILDNFSDARYNANHMVGRAINKGVGLGTGSKIYSEEDYGQGSPKSEDEMDDARYSDRTPTTGRFNIRQRAGESDEQFEQRKDEMLRSRQMQLDGEEARKIVTQQIKEMISSKMANNMQKSHLNRLLARVNRATPENVLTEIRYAQDVARDIETNMYGRQLYQLLNLKTQDRNGRNMSIAKNVSNDVRVVLDNVKGRMYGVMVTDADEAIDGLKLENKRLAEDNRRLRAQIRDGVLVEGTDQYNQAMESINASEAKILDNVERMKGLSADKERTIRENLKSDSGNLQERIDKKMQHMEDCAEASAMGISAEDGGAHWTAEDAQELATLEILKAREDIQGIDLDIKQKERERAEAMNAGQKRAIDTVIDDLKRQRLKLVSSLVGKVQSLVDGGRHSLLAQKSAEVLHRSELIRNMMGDIDGGRGKKRTEREMRQRQKEGGFKALATAPLGSFEYMAHRIDINHMSHDGWFYKYFVTGKNGVMEAENSYLANMRESMNLLQDKTEEILGKRVEKVAEEQNKRYDNTGITLVKQDKDGNLLPREEIRDLSKAEATYLWMVWKMPDGRAKMEHEGYDERSMSEIAEFIGEKNIAWSDWVQSEYLPSIFERYNGRYQEMYGTPMTETENYVPLRYHVDDVSEKTDMTGDKVKFDNMQIKNGSMINRTMNFNRISRTTNAFNLICEHTNEAEEYTAFARVRKDLEDVLNSKAVQNQLNANVAGQFEALRKATTVAVHAFSENIGGVDRHVSRFAKGLIGANIAFRNSTAMKQILSVPAFLGYSQDPRFLVAFLKNTGVEYGKNAGAVMGTMASFGFSYNKMMERLQQGNAGVSRTGLSQTMAWCMENLPSFRERITKGSMGMEALNVDMTDANAYEKFIDKYLQLGMNSNKLIDAITCSVGIKSIYDYRYGQLKKQGMSEDEAKRMALMEADIYYNGTQQSNHVAFMSPMQVSKTAINRMMSVYQNASIGFARKFAESLQNLQKGAHVKRMIDTYAKGYEAEGLEASEARDKAKDVVWNRIRKSVFSALMYGIGTNLIWDLGSRGLIGLFQSDDEKEKALAWASVISYPMRGMPLFNAGASLVGAAASLGTGEEAQMSEYNPMLLFSALNDALQSVGRTAKDFGAFSPMTALKVLDKGLSLAGFRPEIWVNTTMAVSDLVKNGLIKGEDVDKMTDLMLFLQTPNSLRPSVAKQLYGIDEQTMNDLSEEERKEAVGNYIRSILYAMKYAEEGDWRMYIPGMKVLKADQKQKVINDLVKDIVPEELLAEIEKSDPELSKELQSIRRTDELSKMYDSETDLLRKKQIAKQLKHSINAHEDEPIDYFVGTALDKYFGDVAETKTEKITNAYLEHATSTDIKEDLTLQKVKSDLNGKYSKSILDEMPDATYRTFVEEHEAEIKLLDDLSSIQRDINDYKKELLDKTSDKKTIMNKIRELRKEAIAKLGH